MPDSFKNSGPDGDFRAGGKLMTTSEAQSSLKKLNSEATDLEPTALVQLFEIDVSELLFGERLEKNLAYNADNVNGQGQGFNIRDPKYNIFRFHNCVKLLQSDIYFQGNLYHALPITAEGFETNSRGQAATPKLAISIRDENVDSLKILKSLMADLEDLVGAKVTRIRTFAKFLDERNWYKPAFDSNGNYTGSELDSNGNKIPLYSQLPKEIDPDPNSYFTPDVYFVDRKSTETNTAMELELASVINFEQLKLPHRILNINRCPWSYRGEGCCYEYKNIADSQGFGIHDGADLPTYAPPIADENNQKISDVINGYNPNTNAPSITVSEWKDDKSFVTGDIVYITLSKVNYYFIAKSDVPKNIPPPNKIYWISDQCSKTIEGCKLRWAGGAPGASYTSRDNNLPFGGFPGVRKRNQ
jgi:phage-related protein